MPRRGLNGVLLLALVPAVLGAQSASTRRLVTLNDLDSVVDVADPQIAPDGAWIAYTVTSADSTDDDYDSNIWMTSWDGKRTVQLTRTTDDETTPRWSPDGRYLAFLSSRQDTSEVKQLWLLDRAGGEAERITHAAGGVEDLAWSPDGKRLVLVIPDPDSVEEGGSDSTWSTTPRPIVIDRFVFKEDYTGYLGRARSHLYLMDLASRELKPLVTDPRYDEESPSWSPAGDRIAFFSRRTGDAERTYDQGIYVIDAAPGSTPRQVVPDSVAANNLDWGWELAWSPDGREIAYLSAGPPKLIYYSVQKLTVVSVGSGVSRVLTPTLDRNCSAPAWSADGKRIRFIVEDDGARQLAEVPAAGGAVKRITGGRRTISALTSRGDRLAVVASTIDRPAEVQAVDGDSLRPLSRQNDAWLAGVQLATTREFQYGSSDGTEIHGQAMHPPAGVTQKPYPTVLRLHGGPVSEVDCDFDITWQIMAARGYLVLGVSPRGSSGRGEGFSSAIFADWGHKDVEDVLGAVDWAVAQGLADSTRLGVGGWSYGGILTNYVIASTHRFKAATSGAGASNILAGYGTDMYAREYEAELGRPWDSTATWLKLSYPFLHADRITTPTLFMAGENNMNVPLINSEQMYQALRSLGVPTELVIYPGQWHGLGRPSYQADRLRRYLAWYDRFLLGMH
jgi:dipeptidyl aminopeptidase/acylaminoacyl peptidase